MFEVNFLAVLASAVLSMVIGFLWYSPILFAKPWMKLSGLTPEKMKALKSQMPKIYGTSFIASLVLAFVLANLLSLTNTVTLMEALTLGFWVWLGFVATTMLNSVLYEGKPVKLYLINTGYYLVLILAMAALLINWP